MSIECLDIHHSLHLRSVRCKTCNDISSSSRAEYCFCVTCPSFGEGMRMRDRKSVVDVKDLLSSYTQEEHISEWKCEKCSRTGCVRQAGIARPPNVLLVHISRVQQGWAPRVTVDRELTIQYHGAAANTRRKMRYLLFAMIVYRSMGANGGHYFAFVRAGRGQREQWYLADDDEIRAVSFADVQREEPFMLLYEAQKVIPPVETDAATGLQIQLLAPWFPVGAKMFSIHEFDADAFAPAAWRYAAEFCSTVARRNQSSPTVVL